MTDLRTDTGPLGAVVGTVLPAFERTTDFDHWNRYAAVNDEFIDVHMSTEAAQAAGQPDVFDVFAPALQISRDHCRDEIHPEKILPRVKRGDRHQDGPHHTSRCRDRTARVL